MAMVPPFAFGHVCGQFTACSFQVLAYSGQDALTLLAARSFDALLTDIIMLSELEALGLSDKARALYPTLKTLLMYVFTRETAANHGGVQWHLLVKPFHRAAIESRTTPKYRDLSQTGDDILVVLPENAPWL